MKDKDIIQALRICANHDTSCTDCNQYGCRDCAGTLKYAAANRLEELKRENKRLKKENKRLRKLEKNE